MLLKLGASAVYVDADPVLPRVVTRQCTLHVTTTIIIRAGITTVGTVTAVIADTADRTSVVIVAALAVAMADTQAMDAALAVAGAATADTVAALVAAGVAMVVAPVSVTADTLAMVTAGMVVVVAPVAATADTLATDTAAMVVAPADTPDTDTVDMAIAVAATDTRASLPLVVLPKVHQLVPFPMLPWAFLVVPLRPVAHRHPRLLAPT